MNIQKELDALKVRRYTGVINAETYYKEKQRLMFIATNYDLKESNPYFRPVSIDNWGELTKHEKELLNFINEKTFKQACEDIERIKEKFNIMTEPKIEDFTNPQNPTMEGVAAYTQAVNSYEQEKAIKEDNTYAEPTPQTFTSHELHEVVDSMGNYLEKLTPAINEQAEGAHKHMHETVKKEVKKLSDEVTKAQHYNAENLENHSEQLTRLNRLSSERDRLCDRHYLDSQREIGHMQRKIDSLKTWVWIVGTLAVIELILRTILIFLTKF